MSTSMITSCYVYLGLDQSEDQEPI